MSERYLITGVQLGVLKAGLPSKTIKEVIDEIIDKQFIGNSDKKIIFDVADMENTLSRRKLLTNPKLKLCIKCNCIKERTNFYKNKMSKDKLSSWCKDCTNEYYIEYHKNIKEE